VSVRTGKILVEAEQERKPCCVTKKLTQKTNTALSECSECRAVQAQVQRKGVAVASLQPAWHGSSRIRCCRDALTPATTSFKRARPSTSQLQLLPSLSVLRPFPKFHSILAYIPSTRTRFQYRNRTPKKTKATVEQGVKMWSAQGSPRPRVEVDD
jgi:hypothetical protein